MPDRSRRAGAQGGFWQGCLLLSSRFPIDVGIAKPRSTAATGLSKSDEALRLAASLLLSRRRARSATNVSWTFAPHLHQPPPPPQRPLQPQHHAEHHEVH